LVGYTLKYAGVNARSGDVFSNKNILKAFKKHLTRGIKGVENIYTEHKPMLKETLDSLLINKLKEIDYPYAPGTKVTPQTKP
jgi:vacuolar protein sorting-associated protein 45